MRNELRRRYWFEVTLAAVAAALLVLTLITQEWIEALFGVDPDGGSGALEWAIVAGFAVVAIGASLAARYERRRARLAPS